MPSGVITQLVVPQSVKPRILLRESLRLRKTLRKTLPRTLRIALRNGGRRRRLRSRLLLIPGIPGMLGIPAGAEAATAWTRIGVPKSLLRTGHRVPVIRRARPSEAVPRPVVTRVRIPRVAIPVVVSRRLLVSPAARPTRKPILALVVVHELPVLAAVELGPPMPRRPVTGWSVPRSSVRYLRQRAGVTLVRMLRGRPPAFILAR